MKQKNILKNFLNKKIPKSLKVSIAIHFAIIFIIIFIGIIFNNANEKNIEEQPKIIKKINIQFSSLKSEPTDIVFKNKDELVIDKQNKNETIVKEKNTPKNEPTEKQQNIKKEEVDKKISEAKNVVDVTLNSDNKIKKNEEKKSLKKENYELNLLNEINKSIYNKPYNDNNKKENNNKNKDNDQKNTKSSKIDINEKQEYIQNIQQKIYLNWNQSSGQKGWMCRIQVFQNENGVVFDHLFIDCKDDLPFRESIVKAVYNSSPLPTPKKQEYFDNIVDFIFVVD